MKEKNSVVNELCKDIRKLERRIALAIFRTEKEIKEMVQTVKERDPAARNSAEVLLLYSGVHAMMAHRVAHKLYQDGHYFSARALSQAARRLTGIEIQDRKSVV